MNTSLIISILMLLFPLIFLIFRVRRMMMFHQVWITNPNEMEGRAARTNFFIHLVFCVLLFFIALGSLIAIFFYLSAG